MQEFDAAATETVHVSTVTGLKNDGSGEKIYGTPVPIKCILQKGSKYINAVDNRTAAFRQTLSRHEIKGLHRIMTKSPITDLDYVWLPGAVTTDKKAAKQIIAVESLFLKASNTVMYIAVF